MRFDFPFPRQACTWSPCRTRALVLVVVLLAFSHVGSAMAVGQQHEPARPAAEQPHAAQPEAQPNARGAQTQAHTTEGSTAEEHSEGILPTIAKLFNFAVLAGALVYFLRTPVSGYLQSRSTQIRQDLVTAAEMREAASAQLAEIERKLQSLPGELEALKKRGTEDVQAEKARIAEAAAAERARLLEQTRREIEMRLRIARRGLIELAANLAIAVARERIKRSITPDDQLRMLDQYTSQLTEAR